MAEKIRVEAETRIFSSEKIRVSPSARIFTAEKIRVEAVTRIFSSEKNIFSKEKNKVRCLSGAAAPTFFDIFLFFIPTICFRIINLA